MSIKTIEVPFIKAIKDACVSDCGNYYLTISHDNEGAGFQYDCMMDNCNDLWYFVLTGGTDNWETLQDNFKRDDSKGIMTKFYTPITELATGECASWECLTNFLDKLDIPYYHYRGDRTTDDYLFIGYHKDDLPSHYGSDVDPYKSTLKAWYNTWEGLATGHYTCYHFSIQRIDGTHDGNCESCGGFLVDDNLPYGEDVKDVMNSMREHFPSGIVFDDESFEHAIANAKY